MWDVLGKMRDVLGKMREIRQNAEFPARPARLRDV